MSNFVQRASGWLSARLRALAEWPCRAELAMLRGQRTRFVAALDAVEDMVVFHAPDGTLRFANRAAAAALRELSSLQVQELRGKRLAELGLPEELARFIETQRERVRTTGVAVTSEFALPLRSGTRWREQKVSPVFTDGMLSGMVMIDRDVDERKRAQRRFELLSKVSSLVGNLDLDEMLPATAQLSVPELADWSAVDVCSDKTMHRVFVAHRDPRKAGLAAALHRFQPWRARPGWQELLAGRSLLFGEIDDDILRANAVSPEHLALLLQLGICSAIAVPLRMRDETFAVMTFVTTDESGRRYGRDDLALAEELARRASVIIDRARLHEELKASEARFRIALAAARTAVFEQDLQLRYRWYYNVAMDREAIGKTHADLFPLDEAEQLTAVKQHLLDTGEPVRDEIRLTFRGERRVLMAVIDPVRDANGAIVGLIGAASDITREKRVQEDLEQAVTFRERLMGILGHDLRNPLGAILAATGLLRRRDDLAPPAREHIARIERAARRMAEMIRTLLDFTQARFHGILPVSPAPTDLAEVARAIVDELRAAEPDHAIELDVHGDAHGLWDPARLGEVLSNLIGNAIAHGAADEPVRVAIDLDGDDVRLRVHNGGAPIAPELQATLFDPFRRGATPEDGSPTRGLGLGLYIVRQIVLAHAGEIAVDSTDADGTTFTVRLPRAARFSASPFSAPAPAHAP